MNNKKTIVGWVAIGVTVLSMIIGVVYAYGELNGKQKAQGISIETLKDEGCMPARQHETDIKVIRRDIENIDKNVQEILKEVRK